MARAKPTTVQVSPEQLTDAEPLRRVKLAIEPIDADVLMFKGHRTDVLPEGVRGSAPTFSVSETAKVFFGKTSWWMRWVERQGKTSKGGKVEGNKRVGGKKVAEGRPDKRSARKYTLSDIELIAHALAQNGAIDTATLTIALMNVRNVALLWDIPFNTSK